MLPNSEIREISFKDYFNIIWKRKEIVLALLLIIPVTVAIYDSTRQPMYMATVRILIEKMPSKVASLTGVDQASFQDYYYRDQEYYSTQYNILGSRSIAELVFKEMHLDDDPAFRKFNDPIGKLQSQVSVNPVKNTQIVNVSIIDTDPLRASKIANSLAKVYVEQDVEARNRALKQAIGWLESQISDLKNNLEKGEGALNDFVQEYKIVSVPDIETKTESILEGLKQNKVKLETEIAEMSKQYKSEHPTMIALNAQLDEVNAKIKQETTDLLDLSQKMVKYRLLKQEVISVQQMYNSLLLRSKEINIGEKLEMSNVRVVDQAIPPGAPFSPRTKKDVKTSIVFALVLGLGICYLLEQLDSGIHTANDVSFYINLPFLGYVPIVEKTLQANRSVDKNLVCYQVPESMITESFRALRTSLIFASPEERPLKSILVTSSIPSEGKSFIASNLSLVFSNLKERTLLIDADMRRPKLHSIFKQAHRTGLSDFLATDINLERIIQATFIPHLFIITAGTIPPNPSELLSSAKLHSMLGELKSQFDRIIIDAPPVLSVPDALLLAGFVEGVVLVVQGTLTNVEKTLSTKNKIIEAKGKVVGVVLNHIEPKKQENYYYHYYYSKEGERKKQAT